MRDLQRRSETSAASKDVGLHGVAGWLQRHLSSRLSVAKRHREMELVETISLGGRRQLMLVACAGQRFLVGADADGVQAIVQVKGERVKDAWEHDAL
ncbi:flagellar biosynthetic protein FliO [Edaphobacter bradus]|uniref:flagellar biosynthetic protein FliO n=1 Tax=Edaphobacter bradus TaxID=2259016 RepID=UPI0037BEBB81